MSQNIVLKKGLNIPVAGAADLRVSKSATPGVVAIQPSDFKGFIPRLLVKEGDRVLAGSPVLADKMHSEIIFASPVSGTVKEVVRGEKRKLLAVLIEDDRKNEYVDFGKIKAGDAAQVKESLLASGLWPFFVQRPYGILANPELTPKAIFVSAFDTAPLAADAQFCFADAVADIQAGINVLSKIAEVHVSLNAGISGDIFSNLSSCTLHSFKADKHPAGNVGVQISHVSPIRKDETVWTISLLGLAAIGKLARTGRYDVARLPSADPQARMRLIFRPFRVCLCPKCSHSATFLWRRSVSSAEAYSAEQMPEKTVISDSATTRLPLSAKDTTRNFSDGSGRCAASSTVKTTATSAGLCLNASTIWTPTCTAVREQSL